MHVDVVKEVLKEKGVHVANAVVQLRRLQNHRPKHALRSLINSSELQVYASTYAIPLRLYSVRRVSRLMDPCQEKTSGSASVLRRVHVAKAVLQSRHLQKHRPKSAWSQPSTHLELQARIYHSARPKMCRVRRDTRSSDP